VRVRPGTWVDVDAFEAALDRGDPASVRGAIALSAATSRRRTGSPWPRGAAPGAAAAGSPRGVAARPGARRRGDAAAALPLLRRALEIEPANESAWRLLLRLLAENGRRVEAIRQYDACEAALRAAAGPPPRRTRSWRRSSAASWPRRERRSPGTLPEPGAPLLRLSGGDAAPRPLGGARAPRVAARARPRRAGPARGARRPARRASRSRARGSRRERGAVVLAARRGRGPARCCSPRSPGTPDAGSPRGRPVPRRRRGLARGVAGGVAPTALRVGAEAARGRRRRPTVYLLAETCTGPTSRA